MPCYTERRPLHVLAIYESATELDVDEDFYRKLADGAAATNQMLRNYRARKNRI